ncbi:L,D-transpeptidase family protein [Flavihumibacter fluvii]|uniref:L,D-transpeptidase family protein n=1 Tax=Flavihumibacter fluvii TaxID=2838157 RepID=UPI001BDF39EA|nr:L,D-transpeptidase family protein [Flavihumibacter fluvii]ULQ53481.1 L,D-transpeptidase family protein [Flavihumibacter fluvii]
MQSNRHLLLHKIQMVAFCFMLLGFLVACNNQQKQKPPKEVVIVTKPEEIQVKANEQLKELIAFLQGANGALNDSTKLSNYNAVAKMYESVDFEPIWSNGRKWRPVGDSMFMLISKCKEFGLFPTDYHLLPILFARNQFVVDSQAKKNVALWTKTDVLLTDAFFQMARHLKTGRLDRDSTTLRTDTAFSETDQVKFLQDAIATGLIKPSLESLEPIHKGYKAIRAALPAFLDSVKFIEYTYIEYPNTDSLKLISQVARRLQEADILAKDWQNTDTVSYKAAVRQYQQSKGIRTTGIAAEQTIGSLNNTNWEKFKRIAVNLDRYKQLPSAMPETYILVNLPSFELKLKQADSVALQSKVIVGAPKTRTPVLTSEVVNFITYPQWTVPYSIIFKEMLPKIQKDTNYLVKQNLMVVDKNDSVISPSSIDWYKLSKTHFPYRLRQRQGDDNSLGVMKFNFRNKYDVYLHDTNARGLFSKGIRALSHGCVRIQEWEKLAHFLVRDNEIRYHPDTLRAWITRQEKHVISDFLHVPIFIRYFTCEAEEGKIKFFDDIYGDDRLLAQRYFKGKPIN